MALTGPDGETHSHLLPQEQQNGYSFSGKSENRMSLPDRGTWVGPRPGEPLELERAVSILPGKVMRRYVPAAEENADARRISHRNIAHLLEHQPMVEEQRRILIQALGVLDSFA